MTTYDQLANESAVEPDVDQKRSAKRSDRVWNGVTIAALIIMAIVMILPFVWLVSSSLKGQIQIFQYPPVWIPDPIHWDNYTNALTVKPFGLYIINTLKIVALNVIAVVFTSSFCAYGFARIKFALAAIHRRVRTIFIHKAFIDDRDTRTGGAVAAVKKAAFAQPDAVCGEEMIVNGTELR